MTVVEREFKASQLTGTRSFAGDPDVVTSMRASISYEEVFIQREYALDDSLKGDRASKHDDAADLMLKDLYGFFTINYQNMNASGKISQVDCVIEKLTIC